jgi:hypothetical protein
MATKKTSFHIQHIARPRYVRDILSIASDDQSLDADSVHVQLTQEGHQITYDGVRRSLNLGAKLGLFEQERDRSIYTLTARGCACRNLALYRREVYWDVMHFLLFATWELDGHKDYWSWSYANICSMLWRDRPTIKNRKTLFGQLSAQASREFADMDPVVGTETVYAVTNWLRELSPPFLVLANGRVRASQEREWFSAELGLLAVSYLYAVRRTAPSTPILLDRPAVQLLCPLCLASVERILAMIETASTTFPALEINAGEWGSSVVLHRGVDISKLT